MFRQKSYEDWFEDEGYQIVEEILGWLDDAPNGICVHDFTGKDLEEFANEAAYDIWESQAGDYADYLYDQMRDDQMMDD